MPQAKLLFRRIAFYIGMVVLIAVFILKLAEPDRSVHSRHILSLLVCNVAPMLWADLCSARARSWFLRNKTIFIMNFVIATLCVCVSWTAVLVFSLRLLRANASGKRWSHRRSVVCTLAYIRICLQVRILCKCQCPVHQAGVVGAAASDDRPHVRQYRRSMPAFTWPRMHKSSLESVGGFRLSSAPALSSGGR